MKKLISYISSGDFSYKLKTYINHLEYVNDIRTLREIFILSIKYYNIEVYKYMNKHNFLFREIDVYCRVIPTKKVREAFNFYFNVMDYNNLIDSCGNKLDKDYILSYIKRIFLFDCTERKKIKKLLLVKEYFDLSLCYNILKEKHKYIPVDSSDLDMLHREIRLEKIKLLKN